MIIPNMPVSNDFVFLLNKCISTKKKMIDKREPEKKCWGSAQQTSFIRSSIRIKILPKKQKLTKLKTIYSFLMMKGSSEGTYH